MQINITARRFTARDSLKEYIQAEVSSLERVADDIIDAEVILSFENSSNSVKIAEVIVKIPGSVITSTDSTDEFEKSVKGAVEKTEKQLLKIKGKRLNH